MIIPEENISIVNYQSLITFKKVILILYFFIKPYFNYLLFSFLIKNIFIINFQVQIIFELLIIIINFIIKVNFN